MRPWIINTSLEFTLKIQVIVNTFTVVLEWLHELIDFFERLIKSSVILRKQESYFALRLHLQSKIKLVHTTGFTVYILKTSENLVKKQVFLKYC